jgi:hypothetical protein
MKYVLIIPAHNEAAFIEKTFDSTVAQTVLRGTGSSLTTRINRGYVKGFLAELIA